MPMQYDEQQETYFRQQREQKKPFNAPLVPGLNHKQQNAQRKAERESRMKKQADAFGDDFSFTAE